MTIADKNRCAFAKQVTDLVRDRDRGNPVFGLAVHCSGRSIVEQAEKSGKNVLDHAVDYYRGAEYSCHYVIGYDGTIVQVTADDKRVSHIGISAEERALYMSGAWKTHPKLPAYVIKLWLAQWVGKKSPQHLFPSGSANADFVGAEMPPLSTARADGLWYTDEQHLAVAKLGTDLAVRHGWPTWPAKLPCTRLLGHEDLDGFARWDSSGGWDPGGLRAKPRFDWKLVREHLV